MAQDRLIFDDGRKCEVKLKLEMPFLLKRKLQSISRNGGKSLEQLIVYMLDNEVKSVEKILGAQNVE